MNYMELLAKTREMLAKCRGRWPEVAERSGVSHPWISKFMRGKIPNSGVKTLHAVDSVTSQMLNEQQAAADKAQQEPPK